jgi:hypothetical protein
MTSQTARLLVGFITMAGLCYQIGFFVGRAPIQNAVATGEWSFKIDGLDYRIVRGSGPFSH